jgi:branched-chain amino acid transport system permease protein
MKDVIQNLIDAVSVGGLYALVALGIAVVFSILRLVNFAHGELIMIAAYVLVAIAGRNWLLIICAPVAVGIVAALLMERIAFRPVRSADASTMLITSFALSYFIQSLAIFTVGSRPKPVEISPVVTKSFQVGGFHIPNLDPITLGVTATVLLLLVLFLKRTRPGLQMRAAAEDFTMARLLGVPANGVIALAFAISGALAAIVALLITSQSGIAFPTMGLSPVLIGFVAAVVGGLGSLSGACLGGLILGVVTVSLQAWLPAGPRSFRDAFVFALVVVVLILRPRGLIGERIPQGRI